MSHLHVVVPGNIWLRAHNLSILNRKFLEIFMVVTLWVQDPSSGDINLRLVLEFSYFQGLSHIKVPQFQKKVPQVPHWGTNWGTKWGTKLRGSNYSVN